MRRKVTAAIVIPLVLGLMALGVSHRVTAASAATSQNGWTVVDKAGTGSYQVPGSKVKLRIRKGDVATVLLDVASWFDANIEDIDKGADDWGWNVRKIAGSSSYSNHASGTAIDLNAERHPQGVTTSKNLSTKQIDAVREALKDRYKNVVRWGGDYKSRPDAMHFEINKGASSVKSLAASLKGDRATATTAKPTTTRAPATTARAPGTTAASRPGTSRPTTTATEPPTTEPATTEPTDGSGAGGEESEKEMGPVETPATETLARSATAVAATPAFTG